MKARQVSFTQRIPAKLSEYEFTLNKKMMDNTAAANIRPNCNSVVHGALYICSRDVFEKLDVFEMVSKGHYFREGVKVQAEDRLLDAITYIGTEKFCDDELNVVNAEYLEHILCGKDLLPQEYFNFLQSFYSWCKY